MHHCVGTANRQAPYVCASVNVRDGAFCVCVEVECMLYTNLKFAYHKPVVVGNETQLLFIGEARRA